MPQAESPNTTSPSRRAVLAGISILAVPLTGGPPASSQDSELLALNVTLDAIWPEVVALQRASLAACSAADLEVARRLGIDLEIELTEPQAAAVWEMTKTVRAELDTDEVVRKEHVARDQADISTNGSGQRLLGRWWALPSTRAPPP
jgi:hypothetical protein